jgi:hypothetical protein
MPKIVKEVRRHGEAYDVVRDDNGRIQKRPVDAVERKPVARPPARTTPDTTA